MRFKEIRQCAGAGFAGQMPVPMTKVAGDMGPARYHAARGATQSCRAPCSWFIRNTACRLDTDVPIFLPKQGKNLLHVSRCLACCITTSDPVQGSGRVAALTAEPPHVSLSLPAGRERTATHRQTDPAHRQTDRRTDPTPLLTVLALLRPAPPAGRTSPRLSRQGCELGPRSPVPAPLPRREPLRAPGQRAPTWPRPGPCGMRAPPRRGTAAGWGSLTRLRAQPAGTGLLRAPTRAALRSPPSPALGAALSSAPPLLRRAGREEAPTAAGTTSRPRGGGGRGLGEGLGERARREMVAGPG